MEQGKRGGVEKNIKQMRFIWKLFIVETTGMTMVIECVLYRKIVQWKSKKGVKDGWFAWAKKKKYNQNRMEARIYFEQVKVFFILVSLIRRMRSIENAKSIVWNHFGQPEYIVFRIILMAIRDG